MNPIRERCREQLIFFRLQQAREVRSRFGLVCRFPCAGFGKQSVSEPHAQLGEGAVDRLGRSLQTARFIDERSQGRYSTYICRC